MKKTNIINLLSFLSLLYIIGIIGSIELGRIEIISGIRHIICAVLIFELRNILKFLVACRIKISEIRVSKCRKLTIQ